MAAKLVFLTVPIGNLSDLTERVRIALSEGEKFVVEDSRVFMSLLSALGIATQNKEWLVWFDHSDANRLKKLRAWLEQGFTVYLTSDAGSPILADPAYELITSLGMDLSLDSYSGVTSVISALELSRLAPIPFHFHGFLARKKSDWQKQWYVCQKTVGTHIFFLAPHRLEETMKDLTTLGSEIKFCLAKELTKKFQTVVTFLGSEWEKIKSDLTIKGEFVVLFQVDKENNQFDQQELAEQAQDYIYDPSPKKLAKLLANVTGAEVSDVYQKIFQKKN